MVSVAYYQQYDVENYLYFGIAVLDLVQRGSGVLAFIRFSGPPVPCMAPW